MKGIHRQQWEPYWRPDDHFIVGVPWEQGDVNVQVGTHELALTEHKASFGVPGTTIVTTVQLRAERQIRRHGYRYITRQQIPGGIGPTGRIIRGHADALRVNAHRARVRHRTENVKVRAHADVLSLNEGGALVQYAGHVNIEASVASLALNEHAASVTTESDTQVLSDILDALLVLRNNGSIN